MLYFSHSIPYSQFPIPSSQNSVLCEPDWTSPPLHAPCFADASRAEERDGMVRDQLVANGIRAERVLQAMRGIPRHAFAPASAGALAYRDRPLSIGHKQTISQPFIVACMTEQLGLRGSEHVLEIGTGCGYQTAILGQLAREVTSVEIVEPLARAAANRLRSLGYRNLRLILGDGSLGFAPQAPYDGILVTAAASAGIEALKEQLKPGARLIVPVGPVNQTQHLVVVERGLDGEFHQHELMPVRFVPLVSRLNS